MGFNAYNIFKNKYYQSNEKKKKKSKNNENNNLSHGSGMNTV
jgi:hypothetical protein